MISRWVRSDFPGISGGQDPRRPLFDEAAWVRALDHVVIRSADPEAGGVPTLVLEPAASAPRAR